MSTYTHDYTAEYLALFKKSGAKIQISDAAVLAKIGAAPVSHVDVHASDTDYGHVMASSSNPLANGTANPGTSLKYAREDHVHPAQDASHATDADFAKALKNPFMLYLEGAVTAEDRVDGNTDVHLRVIKLDANALEGLISLDNLPVGTDANSIAVGNHTHDYSSVYAPYIHDHTSSDITDLSTVLSGYSPSGHGHNYAGSSSDGGAANSVKEKLKIKLNSGTATEYNGSTEREINITASAVGAATSGHNHDGVYAPVHTHSYLPLAGGVMDNESAVSSEVIEQHGNYYGLAYGSVTITTSITTGSSDGILLVETPIPANTSSGIDFLPPTGGGEQYYQIHITGLDTSNKGKTIDIKIGLGLKASPQGELNASNSGWSSYGTIMPSSITHGVKGNRHAFVIVLPKSSYKLNIDGLFDFGVSRGANFLTQFQQKNVALRGDGGWCLTPDSTTGVTLDGSAMTQQSLPTYSHSHFALSVGNGLKYASGSTYTGAEAREISVKEDYAFSWSGIHTFTVAPKINKTGVLIGKGSSTQIDAKAGSANKQFLKYSVSNGTGSYAFDAISKDDLPNISSLNSGAIAAGRLLVSASNNGAEWLPAGAEGHFLQQTSSGLAFKPIHERTMLTLTSSHTSSSPATFTHTAGTDQTVYLILPTNSTSTTSFYVKIQSPSSECTGDKIQFVVVNDVTTSPDTYNPIVYFKKNNSNDKYIGDYGYDSAGIAESALSIASGFMMNLYCVTVGSATIWRAQRIAEIGFDQN